MSLFKTTTIKLGFYFKRNLSISKIFFKKRNLKSEDTAESEELDNSEYESVSRRHFGAESNYNFYVIHPYVKWGPAKLLDSSPANQLQEALALVRTIQSWSVQGSITVPLESLQRINMFGSGTMKKLQQTINSDSNINAVLINVSILNAGQMEVFQRAFGCVIMDRYKVVITILHLHAVSKLAKLQVSLAEIPYMRANIRAFDHHFMAASDLDTKREMLNIREQNLKKSIKKIRDQRALMRQKREESEIPVIAVVGYTNAGKTALIKALTEEKTLLPQNRLFATLDVTAHSGVLPSRMQVLYMDTVGFITNVPTNLIECFITTLEDTQVADLILHVVDLANADNAYHQKHVLATLQQIAKKNKDYKMCPIITVGNKCDEAIDRNERDDDVIKVSAIKESGIDLLRKRIEESLLQYTNRKIVTITAPAGGDEIRWLYKNSTVTNVEAAGHGQLQNLTVIITDSTLNIFKHHFYRKI